MQGWIRGWGEDAVIGPKGCSTKADAASSKKIQTSSESLRWAHGPEFDKPDPAQQQSPPPPNSSIPRYY
jgi:hypothetical protein